MGAIASIGFAIEVVALNDHRLCAQGNIIALHSRWSYQKQVYEVECKLLNHLIEINKRFLKNI